MKVGIGGRIHLGMILAAVVLACPVLMPVGARGDFSRSEGFETPAEVKRPPRQLVTSRPDDTRVALEDRLYSESTLSARGAADSKRRAWLIALGVAVACLIVAAVCFAVLRPRGGSR